MRVSDHFGSTAKKEEEMLSLQLYTVLFESVVSFFVCVVWAKGGLLIVFWIALRQDWVSTLQLQAEAVHVQCKALPCCPQKCRGAWTHLCFCDSLGQLLLQHSLWRSALFFPVNLQGTHTAPNGVGSVSFFNAGCLQLQCLTVGTCSLYTHRTSWEFSLVMFLLFFFLQWCLFSTRKIA